MTNQLSFEALLCAAASDNELRKFERETAHFPGAFEQALPFFRELLSRHHERMMAGDVDAVMALREDADKLALRLNRGEPGILAGPDAPGRVLERETAAEAGAVPLWGQKGTFTVRTCGEMQVRVEIEGIFGIGASFSYWPGFAAHAVDLDAPFLSPTGYRSFLGIHAEPLAGLNPEAFCARAIEAYVTVGIKGTLRTIKNGRDA